MAKYIDAQGQEVEARRTNKPLPLGVDKLGYPLVLNAGYWLVHKPGDMQTYVLDDWEFHYKYARPKKVKK